MSYEQTHGQRQDSGERPTEQKKPYQKPSFRYERIFETMALSCGKVRSTQGQCKLNTKNS